MTSPTGVSRFVVWPWLTILVLLHLLPFAGRPILIGGDEPHYALMAHSMAVDHDVALENNYREVESGSKAAGSKTAGTTPDRHLRQFGDREVFKHPLGLPLLAAPFVALLQWASPGAAPDILLVGLTLAVTLAAILAGWQLLSETLGDGRAAAFAVFAIYFTTPLWYYSRTFYTEPWIWSFAVLSIWCLARRKWLASSLLLGATLALKETSVLLIGPVLLFAWRRWGHRPALRLAIFPILFLGLWGLKNLVIYGRPVVTFQAFDWGSPLAGAAGLLVDPTAGLLVFAPVLAVAALGWRRSFTSPDPLARPSTVALLIFLGYFLVTAAWEGWQGGSSYASRLLLPTIPAFALPLVVLRDDIARRGLLHRALAVLALAGFTIQFAAATNSFNAMWSIHIVDLLTRRPHATLGGLVLGLILLRRLERFPRRAGRADRGEVLETPAGG